MLWVIYSVLKEPYFQVGFPKNIIYFGKSNRNDSVDCMCYAKIQILYYHQYGYVSNLHHLTYSCEFHSLRNCWQQFVAEIKSL